MFPNPNLRKKSSLITTDGTGMTQIPQTMPTQMPVGQYVGEAVAGGLGRAASSAISDISQGNSPNMGKAVEAAVGSENKELIDKGIKKVKDIKNKRNRNGRKGSSNGRGKGGGPSSGDSRPYNGGGGSPPRSSQNWSPFSVSPPGPKIEVSYQKDNSLYKLPYRAQNQTGYENATSTWFDSTFKTAIRAISRDDIFNFSPNQIMVDASYRIFGEIKQDVTTNTNGGTAQSRAVVTYDDFWAYIRITTEALMILTEIEALQTWSPDYDESNLCIRDLKNLVANDIPLYQARNRLQDQIAQLALPKGLMDYYTRLFYTYKKSPVSGGVHLKMMSDTMLADLVAITDGSTTTPFGITINQINTIVDDLRAKIDEYASMTAFLLTKVQFNYISQRYKNATIDYPCYDAEFNAVYDNLPFFWYDTANNVRIDAYGYRNSRTDEQYSTDIAIPMDVDNVSVNMTGSLLLHWYDGFAVNPDNTSGFPYFTENKDKSFPNAVIAENASNFVLQSKDSTVNDYGFNIRPVSDPYKCVTDHICTVIDGAQWAMIPKGLNTRTYQTSYLSASTAAAKMMYDLFGVKN